MKTVKDVLAAWNAAIVAQAATAAAAAASVEAYQRRVLAAGSGEEVLSEANVTELYVARNRAQYTLKEMKALIKNPRNLPRPVALRTWFANNRDVVRKLRSNATSENSRGLEMRYFNSTVWPSPEFYDTRCAAEADYATNAAGFYQQLTTAMKRTAGAKRKAGPALDGDGGSTTADCSCCLSAPAVFACAAGHTTFCLECMHGFVDGPLRTDVLSGTKLLEGAAADDTDAAALHACCTAGCASKLQVGDTKARIISTLGGDFAPADVPTYELLYANVAYVAARSVEAQLQRELAAKLGAQGIPEPPEVKAHIHELINVVKCPACDKAYFGVTDACQHAYCTCRPTTAFCAYCFQDHYDYQNCVLYPRYSEDEVAAAPDDPEAAAAFEGLLEGMQNGAANRRFSKLSAARVMKAHHINRLLASASSATLRAVLADGEVLTWLREIHVAVDAAACGAGAGDIAACPLSIDGIGDYVCGNVRRAFAQTFEACRNKPYANNHELDTLMRRANEAERAMEAAPMLDADATAAAASCSAVLSDTADSAKLCAMMKCATR
jgi:hypothetical protein